MGMKPVIIAFQNILLIPLIERLMTNVKKMFQMNITSVFRLLTNENISFMFRILR